MHRVGVVAVRDAIAFDLSTPIEVFGWARMSDGTPAYEVLVCGDEPAAAGPLTISPGAALDSLRTVDTVIVPGCYDPARPQPAAVLDALRAAHARGARIVSICVGAFTLAQAGLLDGAIATTHWAAADVFRSLHPQVHLDLGAISRESGNVFTSAGAAAGLDLCLRLIGLDYGPEVAADASRHAVMPLYREGGQAPFISAPPDPDTGDLQHLTAWLTERLDENVSLERMAAHINVSVRTLNRRFQSAYGRSPSSWLLGRRLEQAKDLLLATSQPVEEVARRVGFGSSIGFRARFKESVGLTPAQYRRAFLASAS